MLTIRSEQMRVLQVARFEQFTRYALAHIQATLPELADESRINNANVRLGVTRGLRYFSTEYDVSRYVEIVLRYLDGWTAEDHPKRALEMIASRTISAERRLSNFERWAKTRSGANAR